LKTLSGDVGRGAAQIVLLEGEAGIGKTTLVRRFAEIATASGYTVVRGQNDSDCGAPSYWAWIQVLRELLMRPEIAAVRRRAPHSLRTVNRLVRSEAVGEQGVVAAHDRRLWLFDDVAEVLRLFATACPLLIILEDLQAANEDSLVLLRFLARHLEATRTMVLGTFRRAALSDDHALTATLTELRRVPYCTEMTIGGLSEEDITALVGRRASTRLVREFRRRTGGNPLFLKEILRHAASRFEPDWFARDDAATALRRELAPPGIRDLVAQRVGRLHPDTRAIFDAAAVLGESFELADVADLVGRRSAAIGNDMETLHAQGFFQATQHPTTRQFTHPIVREAARALLSPRRSQQLHDKASTRLERASADERTRRLPQLAYHAFAALPFGSIARAVRHGQAAAAQAAAHFAYEDAAELYRETLAAAAQRQRASSLERAELLVALSEVASRTADQTTARAAAVDGFRLAQRRRRPDLCARAACALGPALLTLQPGTVDDQRVDLLDEALRLIPQRQKAQRIRVYSELAVALYWSPDSRRCMAVAETAVALARKLGQPAPLAHALYARCIAQWRPSAGRPDGASVREAIRVADRAGEGDLAMACAVRLGHVLAEAGDLDGLDRLTANLEQRAQRLGYPQARLWPLIFQASRLTRQRQLVAAEAAIDRVRATALEAWPAGEPHSAFLLGLLRLEQGTFEGLVEVFDRLATWVPDLPIDAPLPLILAGVGELERAARTYAQLVAHRPWRTSDHMGTIASLTMLAACAARFEDLDTASGIYPILAPHAGEYAVVAGVAGLLAPVTHTLGELCGTIGRYDEAVVYFERGIEECRRAELHSDAVRTQLAWARVLARRNASGDRRRARVLGREAQRRAEELDMPLLVADAIAFNSTLIPAR
jgi:tetratricopeptide (TPR) repeat protein